MSFHINVVRLKRIMAREGYVNYQAVSEASASRGVYVSWRTIYNIENGANWSRETLEKLCVALNCSPADLIPDWHDSKVNILETA